MPTTIFLDAEVAATLDNLLQRRDQRFCAIQTEALGTGELDVAEFLEALRPRSACLRMARRPLAGETDFLVRTLDALPGSRAFCAALVMCMNSTPSVWQ